jgi:ribosomal protein S18 acetylase RimI-like enzyme
VLLRAATPDDVGFVAWVLQAASRSHLERSVWQYLYDLDEADVLDFLGHLAVTEVVHPFHLSLVTIAEVDGQPAAAASAFDPATQGFASIGPALVAATHASGLPAEDPDRDRRFRVLFGAQASSPAERPWTIENVATLPTYRRRGLVDALLDALFETGRAGGFDVAQIGLFIGNEPARTAYLKVGFEPVAEQRDATWERELGCPGTELMLRPLR